MQLKAYIFSFVLRNKLFSPSSFSQSDDNITLRWRQKQAKHSQTKKVSFNYYDYGLHRHHGCHQKEKPRRSFIHFSSCMHTQTENVALGICPVINSISVALWKFVSKRDRFLWLWKSSEMWCNGGGYVYTCN